MNYILDRFPIRGRSRGVRWLCGRSFGHLRGSPPSVSGNVVTVFALAEGSATVVVTVRDAGGLAAQRDFTVTVPNRPSETTDAIPLAKMYVGGGMMVDLSIHLGDPDGDALVYTADVSVLTVAEATVADGELGVARLTITARDPGALTAEQRFPLSILSQAGHLHVDSRMTRPTWAGSRSASRLPPPNPCEWPQDCRPTVPRLTRA